jgi:hypothetical protein
MKKLLFSLIFALFLLSNSHAQLKKFSDLVGRWLIVGEQNTGGSLEIIDSATIYLTYMGEKKKISDYTFDFSKTPCWFDFSTQDTASVIKIKSLVQRISDSMIKWQLFVDEDRTDHFSSTKGILYYLKKDDLPPTEVTHN